MVNCDKCHPGFSRRSFLRFSLGAAAAGSIPGYSALAQQTVAEKAKQIGASKGAKSIIMLWMGGGPTQLDTWDAKPGTKNGGETKGIDTGTGAKFNELLPICASQAKHMSVIRSMMTNEGAHERGTSLMHLGIQAVQAVPIAPLGTIVSYEKGDKKFPLPHFIAIDPPLIPQSAVFGDDYLPFRLNNADNPIPNLRRNVGADRDKARAALLLDQNKDWDGKRQQAEVRKVENGYVKSEDVMNTPLLKAFNYNEEPAELRKAYGDRFGINCLLARRLVQSGVSFVEIGMGGWDTHNDNFNAMKRMLPTLDKGMGTLIKDLAEKDMLKDTLVFWAGEFGRTPSVNGGNGRDHHANGFSVVLAGGKLAGGRVYGDTGSDGGGCSKPVPMHNLYATILGACGIDPNKKYEAEGRMVKYASNNGNAQTSGVPIKDLF